LDLGVSRPLKTLPLVTTKNFLEYPFISQRTLLNLITKGLLPGQPLNSAFNSSVLLPAESSSIKRLLPFKREIISLIGSGVKLALNGKSVINKLTKLSAASKGWRSIKQLRKTSFAQYRRNLPVLISNPASSWFVETSKSAQAVKPTWAKLIVKHLPSPVKFITDASTRVNSRAPAPYILAEFAIAHRQAFHQANDLFELLTARTQKAFGASESIRPHFLLWFPNWNNSVVVTGTSKEEFIYNLYKENNCFLFLKK
jgi:hypothetical protein